MTIEEKARAYDEALQRARALNNGETIYVEAGTTTCEYIFPELKESEDEKIRKDLIEWIEEFPDTIWRGHYKKDVLTWLEMQGEQTHAELGKSEVTKTSDQKLSVKVEPKFKVKDWIVFNGLILHIDEVVNGYYITTSIGDDIHNSYDWDIDNVARLWDISDAKCGDVLVDVYGNIGIFDKCYDFDWMSCCSLGNNGGFQHFTVEHENEKTYPATKEQRYLLFQKMTNAGYEWDDEKKELREIEQKHADKVEPKFHEGEWITNGDYNWRIVDVKPLDYTLQSQDGNIVDDNISYVDDSFHLWTIKDAEDGDVLSGEIDGDKYIFSFKKLNGRWIETQGVCYCETTGECIEDARFCNHYQDFFKPASKEECDVLLLKTVNHQLK